MLEIKLEESPLFKFLKFPTHLVVCLQKNVYIEILKFAIFDLSTRNWC